MKILRLAGGRLFLRYDERTGVRMRPAPDWKGGVAGGGLPVLYLAGCKKFDERPSAEGRL